MKVSLMVGTTFSKENEGYPVYYRVNDCNRKRILIASGMFSRVRFTGNEFPMQELDSGIKNTQAGNVMSRIERFMKSNKDLYGEDLKKRLMAHIGKQEKAPRKVKLFTDFCREYMEGMKPSTFTLYRLTVDRITEFDRKARLTDIDVSWLTRFEAYLRGLGLSTNGIAQKMRNIRCVVNYCRNEGYQCIYPFGGHRGYKIREEITEPDDLSAQQMADLRDYPVEPWQEIYRDLLMLSFYLGGINAIDLLLCKGLRNGRLVFKRKKTDKVNANTVRPVNLPVCKEAMEIIEKYKGRDYLLNVMDRQKSYKTFLQHWNKALKKIGPKKIVRDKAGKLRKIEYMPIFPNLKTYTARYSFASIAANDLDISERTIGKCLGHSWADSKSVTSRYISHDQKKIDEAVLKVVGYLGTFKGKY